MNVSNETPVRASDQPIFKFETSAFPFDVLVGECVADYLRGRSRKGPQLSDLSALHRHIDPPQLADVAAAIYDLFLSREFITVYDELCTTIVTDLFAGRAAYQA